MADNFPPPAEYASRLDALVRRLLALFVEKPELVQKLSCKQDLVCHRITSNATPWQVRVALAIAKRDK